jgi:hypothetical protein
VQRCDDEVEVAARPTLAYLHQAFLILPSGTTIALEAQRPTPYASSSRFRMNATTGTLTPPPSRTQIRVDAAESSAPHQAKLQAPPATGQGVWAGSTLYGTGPGPGRARWSALRPHHDVCGTVREALSTLRLLILPLHAAGSTHSLSTQGVKR